MKTNVSRGTLVVLADGRPACVRCLRRPKVRGRNRWYSYCSPCKTEYNRGWRASGVQRMLSPEESQLIDELRAAVPVGRHRAA